MVAEGQRLARLGGFSWHVESGQITWTDQLYCIFEFEPGGLVTLGACPRISRAVPKKRRCHVARIYAHSVESVGQLAGSPQQAVQRAISNENHHSALGLRSQGSVNLQDIMCHAQQCPLALNFPQAA